MRKRILSILLTVCMVLSLLPTVALAAETTGTFGEFTVTYDGDAPTYTSNTLTLGSGTYTISGTTTVDKIVVSSGAVANITLSNVEIDVSSTDLACAFDMTGATVNLTLSGTNSLKSGTTKAGLRVPSGTTLTITGTSTGSLQATSAPTSTFGTANGAGIGGNANKGYTDSGEDCGTVTIRGGNVTATGGGNSGTGYPGGAGIGGGSSFVSSGGAGGTVTISGGTVTATGGGSSNGGGAAGIGGGGGSGDGGTVTISGGNVIATGGGTNGTSWPGGAGIGGGGRNGNGGTVTIVGGSVKATGGSGEPIGAAIGAAGAGAAAGSLTNGSANGNMPVSLYTLALTDFTSATEVTALTTTLPLGYTYGTNDMKTDTDGKLYVYLPANKTGASVTAGGTTGDATSSDFTAGYTVSGTVSAGEIVASVSGLTVNLYASSDTTFSTALCNATTDGGGTYAIRGIPNGSYVARVAGVDGSYAASVSNAITVSNIGVSGADITMKALTTQSIAVKPGSHKTAYLVGDLLDVTNLNITVTRSDGSTYDKNVTADMVSGFDSIIASASLDLTITFDGRTTSYNVSVNRVAYSGAAAPAPTFVSKKDTQVTLGAVTVSGQTVEYGKNTSNTTPTVWQDGTTFTDLTANTTYYFFARIKQTATMEAGGVSTAFGVTTKAAGSVTAPDAPAIGTGSSRPTSDAITINTVAGNEYFISTSNTAPTTWPASSNDYFKVIDAGVHTFTGLDPATQYYIHFRTAETDDAMPSSSGSVSQYTLPETPAASAVSINYAAETISFDNTFEVSASADFNPTIASGSAIIPGTTYYVRVAENGGAPASEAVSFTIPARPATPTAITAANITKTETTITIANTVAGQEYQVNGTWYTPVSGKVEVSGLAAGTEYSILTRIKASANTFASANSESLTVKTKTAPADAPAEPAIETDADKPTSDSITISTAAGNEYYISTSATADWIGTPNGYFKATVNGTHKFDSLSPATKYYIHFRTAETDDAMPSSSGSVSQYTLPETPATSAVSINYAAETISFDNTYEVSASADFNPTIASGSAITPGTTYYVRVAANGGTPASEAVSLILPVRPLMPAATAADETVAGKNDGRISGVTAAMEWKAAAGGNYTAVTVDQASNGISGLQDGTYYVRYMAVSGTGFKSDEQVITIAAGHTITVTFHSQGGSAVDAITGKAYGDKITAPVDPVRSGFYFAGWYKEAACTNPWTFTLDTLTDQITLFAKWSAIPTYTVTGKIVDEDDTSLAVEGATVRMMQGATQFGTTGITNSEGDFTIYKVPPGIYNLVITKGTKTAIVKVEVSSGNVAIGNAALPSGNANSVLVVSGSATPNVVVGGLNSEAGTQLERSANPSADNVEVKLIVEKKDASTATKSSEVTGTVTAAGKQLGMILEIDVRKTVNGTEDPSYNQTNGLIEINIPLPAEMQGKATYAIYRYHGAVVDTITETPNADQERIVVDRANWTIVLYARKFSTYAIGYTNPASPRGSGGGTAASSTTAAAIESQKTSALPYYVENGKVVFIGLSKDASGTMKYIAPEGVKVLFQENPKDFRDIAGHWAKSNIDFVTERELFLGIGDGNFSPQSGMTRAMFATVIGRLYERSYGKLLQKDDNNFTDIDNDLYYAAYIDWASKNNIISGIGGGLFKPDREITRQEMAAILYRFAEFLSVLPSGDEKIQLNYPDAAGISSWATEAAGYCQQTGIITGRLGGNFVPQGTATRAEVAAILQRFIESSVK